MLSFPMKQRMQNILRHTNNNTDYTGLFCVGVCLTEINTLWTGDADLHFYITTVQDG